MCGKFCILPLLVPALYSLSVTLHHLLVVNKQYFLTIFSHDESCDQSEAAQDGFNGSQHVCYLISFYHYIVLIDL